MTDSTPLLIDVEDAHVVYRVFEDRRGGGIRRVGRKRRREIHALRGVSFQMHRGETIGIVGHNGSGKSTLLSALTGLQPLASGLIRVSERPTLLGVGAALQGSLSGRRNIELGGLALGLTPEEVDDQAESIIEFAELADFIDLPLATYSSGMRARLAFSIATASIPEILLVDEALAVGDAAFSRRSAQRIDEIRDAAGAVVLVSHNMEEIARSCDRTIWIDHGVVRADGPTFEVVEEYQRKAFADQTGEEKRRAREANLRATSASGQPALGPTTGPRTFYLHIGVSMAGTQGVQSLLSEAEPALREAGYWRPTVAGRENQYPLVTYSTPLGAPLAGIEADEWETWRADFAQRFLDACPTGGNAIATSAHASSYLDEGGIDELSALLGQAGFERLVPIMIVRRQDERASQRSIERLRSGDVAPFDGSVFLENEGYDLASTHDRWNAADFVDHVELRLWPSSLTAPTPAEHVFDILGVDAPLEERRVLLDQLPDVDVHGMEFVRRLGVAMREQGGASLRSLRFALATLAKSSTGELAIAERDAQLLMQHFEASNRRIAELMGGDAAAYLLAPPNAAAAPNGVDLEFAAQLYRHAVSEMR